MVHAGGRNCSALVPHFGDTEVPEGKKGGAELVPVQADTGRYLAWRGLLPVRGEKRGEEHPRNPSRLWSPP